MLHVNIKKKMPHFLLDVSFSVGREIAVLFGPSGAGKTSILDSIAGLTSVDDGEITLGDRVLLQDGKAQVPVHQFKVGYMFQDYALFPHKTVWENIAYGMKSEEFAVKLMKQLEVDPLKDAYPHEISGGEKQRVALIRAVATQPDLLLLDEPFAALDDKNRLRSRKQLLDIHKQWEIPIIMVTHSREDAQVVADKILYMEEGKLIEEVIKQ